MSLVGALVAALLGGSVLVAQQPPAPQRAQDREEEREQQPAGDEHSEEGFRCRTGVELINVSATVIDGSGRFVPNLRKEDFVVFEDGEEQTITHFNAERVPVSLGIVLDTSGSMAGEKMAAAREALHRFLFDLLGPEDEVFLYRFDATPQLVAGWTTDRRQISDELMRVQPRGGTALYDAVAEAIPLAQKGRHRKKALVIISDGNDTSSRVDVSEVKELIRETEVLVYAIGIDAQMTTTSQAPYGWRWPRGIRFLDQRPTPLPFPIPGRRRPSPPPTSPTPPITIPGYPPRPPVTVPPATPRNTATSADRVNVAALREITDDSGGRTEIVRFTRDLDPATAGIADELSKQYYLGYPSPGHRDGRWHNIRVEVRDRSLKVRARRGYVATP
jgi:VWFA-related protein